MTAGRAAVWYVVALLDSGADSNGSRALPAAVQSRTAGCRIRDASHQRVRLHHHLVRRRHSRARHLRSRCQLHRQHLHPGSSMTLRLLPVFTRAAKDVFPKLLNLI